MPWTTFQTSARFRSFMRSKPGVSKRTFRFGPNDTLPSAPFAPFDQYTSPTDS